MTEEIAIKMSLSITVLFPHMKCMELFELFYFSFTVDAQIVINSSQNAHDSFYFLLQKSQCSVSMLLQQTYFHLVSFFFSF